MTAEPRWRQLRAGAVTLAAAEVGEPDRPAVVVAHGVGSSPRFVLEAFAPPLLAAGRRVVTYALRGHGGSSPAPDVASHHLDAHAADLAAVVSATGGNVEVVGGVSLGGHAAVRWAARTGFRGQVLACLPAWIGSSTAGEGPHAAVAAEVRAVGVAGMVARLRSDRSLQPWLRATLLRDLASHDPASLAAALVALDGAAGPTVAELRALPGPLGCVAWPDDPGHPLAVAHEWAATAARGRVEVISLAELQETRTRLGEAAVRALRLVPPSQRR